MSDGELNWMWCPYCHSGIGCVKENDGTFVCPVHGRFTQEQSQADIKRQSENK